MVGTWFGAEFWFGSRLAWLTIDLLAWLTSQLDRLTWPMTWLSWPMDWLTWLLAWLTWQLAWLTLPLAWLTSPLDYGLPDLTAIITDVIHTYNVLTDDL